MSRLLLFLLVATSVAHAGVVYTATTRSQTGEAIAVTKVRGYIQGTNARLEFLEGSTTSAGTYILTRDGGKSFIQVIPERETFTKWEAPSASIAEQEEARKAKAAVSEPKVEKLLDEDGGTILGMKTRHVRYRTSYTFTITLRRSYTTSIVSEDDLWITQDIQDPGLKQWLAGEANEQSDSLLRSELAKINGVPLKRKTVLTSIEEDGESETTNTEMQVSELRQREIPESSFTVPVTYKQVAMPKIADSPGDHDH